MRIIRHFLFWVFTILQLSVFAQVAPNKYVVFFTDKENTPYSINSPENFLTQRALDRRLNAGIAIDSTDLPVDPVYLDSIETTGAEVIYKSKWFNFAVVIANEVDILTIEDFGFVSGVSKRNNKALELISKDKFVHEQDLRKSTLASYNEVQEQINVDNLHDMGYRGSGIRIAVIDAGFTGFDIATEFEHLYTSNRLIDTRNVATNNSIYSSHTHGTSVSSIMCGDLGDTYKGVATDAEYILIRSETGATEYLEEEYAWVAAAEFADSLGADIINSSLGYTTFDWPDQNHTYDDLNGSTTIASRAAGLAFNKGILVVTSAGNLGNDDWYYIGVPGDNPDVLTIGSVDMDGNKSDFSSVGLPEHIYKPDISACGDNAPFLSGGEVYNGSGTSFSSPLVAGAAACLWQSNPDKTNAEIASAIRASASLYPNGNQKIGYGIPDFALAMSILNDSSNIPSDPDRAEFLSAYRVGNQLFLKIYSPVESIVEIKVHDLGGKIIHAERLVMQPMSVNSFQLKYTFTQTENQIVLVHLDGNFFNETRKVSLF